jgi:hypothetical protein
MSISLDEAIEIHAEVLRRRHDREAPTRARERALALKYTGDHDGHAVWLKVAERAERLLSEVQESSATISALD